MATENKYQDGKVYKIVGEDGAFYVGSTTYSLSHRLSCHKANAKIHPTRKLYEHFNQKGWNTAKIELLRDAPCASKKELVQAEQQDLQRLRSEAPTLCLNIHDAETNPEETRKRDLERRRKQYKECEEQRAAKRAYYETHKEEILQKRKEKYAEKKSHA